MARATGILPDGRGARNWPLARAGPIGTVAPSGPATSRPRRRAWIIEAADAMPQHDHEDPHHDAPKEVSPSSEDALEAFLAEAGHLASREVEARHTQGARYAPGASPAVLKPATDDEVAFLLRLARRHGQRVVCQGAHTGLVGGATPQGELVLSTDRLRGTFEVDVLERTLRVSAGYRLSEVNQRLSATGLHLAIDLGADPSLGGMLAHNTGGTRMMRYGDVRAQTLAVGMVLPDGTQVALGRGLQKDNAALPLHHLAVGSHGALGVITEATLRVHRLPVQSASALVAPATQEAIWALYRDWTGRFGSLLSAFEGLSARALDAALAFRRQAPPFHNAACAYSLLVELSSELACDVLDVRQLLYEALEAAFEEGLVVDAVLDDDDALWALRHSVGEGLRHLGQVIGFDVSLPRRQLWAFREDCVAWLARSFPEALLCDFGHLGDGGQHMNVVWPHGSPTLSDGQRQAMRRGIWELVALHGGSFSAEHGLGPAVAPAYAAHSAPAARHLASRVATAWGANASLGRFAY
jgi:FAD/FMN-containing dehydrogenase